MNFSKLLEGITVTKILQQGYGQTAILHDIEVKNIQYDSRKVRRGDVFIALRGTTQDGTKFITHAIEQGAKVIVTDNDSAVSDYLFIHKDIVKVVVPDARIALSQMSANFYEHPSHNLTMVGVTGTNGKTTTSYLIKSLLKASGKKTGLIGTIEYRFDNEIIAAELTTPESLELQSLLRRMRDKNCSAIVMEVSSHALHQNRVYGIRYDAAVFTNLTQDHLDYHGTMEAYFKAKKKLFDSLPPSSWAIINIDNEWGKKLFAEVKSNKISFGISESAEVKPKKVSLSTQETQFFIEHNGTETFIETQLLGRFNVFNILAAFATGIALGIDKETMQKAFRNAKSIQGRFERIVSPQGWMVVIDYAHTPDALENTLCAVREILGYKQKGKVITVFGCGGNRDRTKRPLMAHIATKLSDVTIITSDNPRHEEPNIIIDEIISGVKTGSVVYREIDRSKAIVMALELAQENDVVLIAGKGHEEYQIIGDTKIPFSDRKIVEKYLNSKV